ncbi:MAG: DUF1990 domain-containing protein [Ardenticatenales bacterium]|nr:DUF1990 domain-containing protein [Ardenticatenales bacterium]
MPLWQRYQKQLDALHTAPLNFDLERRHEYTEASGWHIDEYEAELPPELPGHPVPGGSWEIGRRMMQEYKFPDPTIITGIYYPDRPLAERVMLLKARFLFLTFYFGVKVGSVTDEVRETEKGAARIWGFNYQTLQGHFERGQMDFEIWKWLESGKVTFRIHAFSQPGEISNLIYRLGFKLFGRPVQRRFARRALERMQQLVQEALKAAARHEPAAPVEATTPQPASADSQAEEKMAEIDEKSKVTK